MTIRDELQKMRTFNDKVLAENKRMLETAMDSCQKAAEAKEDCANSIAFLDAVEKRMAQTVAKS